MWKRPLSPKYRLLILSILLPSLAFMLTLMHLEQTKAVSAHSASYEDNMPSLENQAQRINLLAPPSLLQTGSTKNFLNEVSWNSSDRQPTYDLAWGDMDGDGDLDLAVANNDLNQLYENDGLGNFTIHNTFRGSRTRALAWGDMDGDGDLDLAVGNYGQINQIYVNLGNGKIDVLDIGDSRRTSDNKNQTYSIAWGDMDGDGDLDLAVGNYRQANQLYKNDGQGNFVGQTLDRASRLDTRSIAWGDMNGDGHLDLAVGNGGDHTNPTIDGTKNLLYKNDGNGEFVPHPFPEDVRATWDLAWGDMNGDGHLDLVVGNKDQPHQLYTNDGEGNFDEAIDLGANGFETRSIDLGDADGDGDLDIAVGHWGYVNQVYENIGNNRYTPFNLVDDTKSTYAIAWGDSDGDGDLDLAVGNLGHVNQIYENKRQINFLPVHIGSDQYKDRDTLSIAWGDMNGDGYLDLVVGNDGQANQIYENDRNGAFSIRDLDPSSKPTNTTSVAWGDMNGDGYLDLAVGNNGQANQLYGNDGKGNFTFIMDFSPSPRNSWDIAWGDCDNDGAFDLAVGNNGQANQLYKNKKDEKGEFIVSTLSNDKRATRSVAWGDADGDGDLDLAVGNWGQINQLYVNNGQCNFTSYNLGNDAKNTFSMDWGDMDGDGDLDLAVGNYRHVNQLYENNGNGNFTVIDLDPTNTRDTTSVAWGDMDGDGDLDLAVGNETFLHNQIYENDGRGNFTGFNIRRGTRHNNTFSVAWGDFDNDGDLDLGVGNATESGTKRHVFEGRNYHERDQSTWQVIKVYKNEQQGPTHLVNNPTSIVISPTNDIRRAGLYNVSPIIDKPIIPITYTLYDQENRSIGAISAEFSLDGGGKWQPAVAAKPTITTNLLANPAATHIYYWDVYKSNFFGQSSNVLFRIRAFPQVMAGTNSAKGTYAYTQTVAGPFQRPFTFATTGPFSVRGTQIRVRQNGNDQPGSVIFHLPQGDNNTADLLRGDFGQPLLTNQQGYLVGRPTISNTDQLLALWPVPTSILKQMVADGKGIPFTDNYTLFYTSGTPTETGVEFATATANGEQILMVSSDNKLLLFHLNVSLEWDARNDETFLIELEQRFQQASAILYDISDGQVALGQINLFHNKAYWGQADIVIHADNGLRPWAAIGGIVDKPTPETLLSREVITEAYFPGQIHMGTSWDPYSEQTADLGEDWTRALAHELAHYLLFLPDNYLGLKPSEDNGKITNRFGIVDCPNSFMTTTSNPAYTELLTNNGWENCHTTLAHSTTGRWDWKTVQTFYPMLEPDETLEGPSNLPLAVTRLLSWVQRDETPPLRSRNFDIRNKKTKGRWRLPSAQAYLFKKNNPSDDTDDTIMPLGSPTGGGDRLKIRGAAIGDRLCLFDPNQAYTACIDAINLITTTLLVTSVPENWQPEIIVKSITSHTIDVKVIQPLAEGEKLKVQVFPMHYGSATCNAPTAVLETSAQNPDQHQKQLWSRFPDFNVAIHLSVLGKDSQPTRDGRESVAIFKLNPPWDTKDGTDEGPGLCKIPEENDTNETAVAQQFVYTPIANPNIMPVGGPNIMPVGGPNIMPVGGPSNVPIGGPNIMPVGGPNNIPRGGPNIMPVGGTGLLSNAPILSADSQVLIYSTDNFFADNGVDTLQIDPVIPESTSHPWLVAVSQAYSVTLKSDAPNGEQVISIAYLQRNVPPGYEETLTIYFLASCLIPAPCKQSWEPLITELDVENLAVARLKPQNGTYALMSTIKLPEMEPGWNLFAYPLPIAQRPNTTLQSIKGSYTRVFKPEPQRDYTELTVLISSINIRRGPSLNAPVLSYLRRGETIRPLNEEPTNGWWQIECPPFVGSAPQCWVTASSKYVAVTQQTKVQATTLLPPSAQATSATLLEPGQVYWVFIDGTEKVTAYIAPPLRQPDGTFMRPEPE